MYKLTNINQGKAAGLLGLSGMYGNISQYERNKSLTFILNNFELIDTATVYGVQYDLNEVLANLADQISGELPVLCNKIGADLQECASFDELRMEYETQRKKMRFFGRQIIMLHRPKLELAERDNHLYTYLKELHGNSLMFGLSTNSLGVINHYLSIGIKINFVQMAINFLDYKNNLNLLKRCKELSIQVHGRSVLASGILSRVYEPFENVKFTDPLRRRYCDDQNKEILAERLRKANEVHIIHQRYCESFDYIPKANFVYELMQAMPNVDLVIRGGSCLSQFKENSYSIRPLESEFVKDFYDRQLMQLQARYFNV